MMRFTLIAAIVALARAGHDSWGCAPDEGWTDTEHPDDGLPSNFCVVGGDGQPIAKGLPGFATGGIVGIVVLGAAGADGKPKLACVTSKAAYPDLTVDIMGKPRPGGSEERLRELRTDGLRRTARHTWPQV